MIYQLLFLSYLTLVYIEVNNNLGEVVLNNNQVMYNNINYIY